MSERYLKVAESHWFTNKSLQKNAKTNNNYNNNNKFIAPLVIWDFSLFPVVFVANWKSKLCIFTKKLCSLDSESQWFN